MRVLAINFGSSSLKYQLIETRSEARLAAGVIETSPRARGGDSASRWRAALAAELRRIVTAGGLPPQAVAHRFVHGGEHFRAPVQVDAAVLRHLRRLRDLAPLQNPLNLLGIEVCRTSWPEVPQIAVFDTAFHRTLPPHAYRYAVPQSWYERYGIRRFGFHGTAHRYAAETAARHLGRPLARLNLITAHLGNGASITAIRGGRSVDTSMGFTPAEGLVMGTRCGDIDPCLPFHLVRRGMRLEAIEHALDHQSGLYGLCGTHDMRAVLARVRDGDATARLALDVYCQRVRKYVGAYLAVLGRVDALVFTGGVGENAAAVRARVLRDLDDLGLVLDGRRNRAAAARVRDIHAATSRIGILVVRADEEWQLAIEAERCLRRRG